ncbi:RIP metalloprotease [Patescibacteria group bacterium]
MLPPLIIFLIVLSILVFIHEFGHFIAAKKNGIKVEEFGFGYPPRLWGKQIGETLYSINWIPFGGFVRIFGQESHSAKDISVKDKNRAFFAKSKKARALVLVAGALGNFLLGILCFALIYSKIGIPEKLDYVKIAGVTDNSPAKNAGLKEGDKVLAVNGKKTISLSEFIPILEQEKGKEIVLQTQRGDFSVLVRENPPENEGRLGVIITDIEKKFYPWWQMPFRGMWEGTKEALSWGLMIFLGLGYSIKQIFLGVAPEVAGPIGIYQLTTTAAKQGILELIQFVGILSVNLAVINMLPIPAFDGGHLVFLLFGDFLGKKRKDKVEHGINIAGFVIIISLMVLLTANDLIRIFKSSPIIASILSFFHF